MSKITSPNTPDLPARPSLRHPGVLLATWFGSGYLPKAPGTWGSVAALPFAWIMMQTGGFWLLAGASLVVFVVGLWAAKDYMDRSGTHDPGPVVIDEVAGQWIVLLIAPLDPISYGLSFILFRLFDILKPWPISWADKSLGGAWGVMLDDVLAGIAGLVCLYGILLYGGSFIEGLM